MDGETAFPAIESPQSRVRHLDARIAGLAERQHGVVALRQLTELGLSPRAARDRVAAGRLHRIDRGVYAVGHRKLSRQGWWMAAVLFGGPGTALSRRCGGAHWNLLTWGGRAQITTPTWRRSSERIEIHTATLPAEERTVHCGIPITTVARTILDLASVLDEEALARVVEEAEQQRLSSPLSLPTTLERHRGERGTVKLRRVLEAAGYGMGVTNRRLEELFVAFLAEHRLPHPELNPALFINGSFLHPDCLWRSSRVIVELQSVRHHGSAGAMSRDAARFRRLAIAGYTVIAVTWAQLHDPAERRALARDLTALLS